MAKDFEKLLGGYATGTLTEEERKALFEAALDEQQIFNALADEEALKELLEHPESRERLLAVLAGSSLTTKRSWLASLLEWFRRPFNLTLAGSVAVAAVAVFVFVDVLFEEPRQLAVSPVSELLRPTVRGAGDSGQREEEPPLRSTPRPPDTASLRSGGVATSKAPVADTQPALTDQRSSPRFSLSVGSPNEPGPARQFFYSQSGRQRQASAPAPTMAPRRSTRTEEYRDQAMAKKRLPDLSGIAKRSAEAAPNWIGLKLALQKQDANGVFFPIQFNASFDQQDKLRLMAEANTDGYLYILEAGDGSWRRLFPPPRDAGGRPAQASIRAGQQIQIPLLESGRSSRDLGQTKLFIVLSRDEIQELTESWTKTPREKTLGRAIQGFLERWRPTTEGKPVIIVEEGPGQTIHFVGTAPTQIAPLVVEFDVAQR